MGPGTSPRSSFPPGHDKNPLTDEQLGVKYHKLADPAIGPDRAHAIWDRLMRLESDQAPHEVISQIAPIG